MLPLSHYLMVAHWLHPTRDLLLLRLIFGDVEVLGVEVNLGEIALNTCAVLLTVQVFDAKKQR